MKRLGINTILLSGSTLGGQALTAVTYWILARNMSQSDFGVVVAAIGIAAVILGTLDFGINANTIRTLAQFPSNQSIYMDTLSAKLTTSGSIGLLWIICTSILAFFVPQLSYAIPLGFYIFLADAMMTVNVLPRSREQMAPVAAAMVADKLACMIATVFVMFMLDGGRWSLPLGMVAGSLTSFLLSLRLTRVRIPYRLPSVDDILDLWRDSAAFGLSALALQVQRLDVSLVAVLAGPTASGIYAAPSRLTNLLNVLPQGLAAAIFPLMSATGQRGARRRGALNAIWASSALTAIAMLVIYTQVDQLVPLILGTQYNVGVPVLKVFLGASVLGSFVSPLAALLQAEGKETFVAKAIGFASFLGLCCISVGALVAGAMGGASGFLIMQVIMCAMLAAALVVHPVNTREYRRRA